MSSLSIVEHVKTLAAHYSAVLELANLLEGVGSIEQATAEANSQATQALNQRDAATAELARINALLADANVALENAKAEAGRILDQAAAEAELLRQSANSTVQDHLAAANALFDGLSARIDSLKIQSVALDQAILAKQAEFNTISQQIADAKAAVIAALG